MLFLGKKVRYGIVGGGHISQFAMMPGIKHTGNSKLTALVTGDPVKADKLAKKYGIKNSFSYEQYADFVKSGTADAVYVALPNSMHKEFVIPALKAEIHVLLEKPMATSERECDEINAAAAKSGAKLMIAYRLHFEPANLRVLELVRSGRIGAPRIFNSVFSQKISPDNHRAKMGYWAGVAADMGPYPINAARALFGAEPISIWATGSNRGVLPDDTPDTVTVVMNFPNAQIAQFTVSYAQPATDDYRIIGDQGEIALKPGFTYGDTFSCTITVDGKSKTEKIKGTDQFGGEMQYFSNCILKDLQPEPDGEEGWCDVRIIAAIERSLLSGKVEILDAYERRLRPSPDNVVKLRPVREPSNNELINARSPTGE